VKGGGEGGASGLSGLLCAVSFHAFGGGVMWVLWVSLSYPIKSCF